MTVNRGKIAHRKVGTADAKRLKMVRAKRSVHLGFGATHQQAKAQEVYTCALLATTPYVEIPLWFFILNS